jgi:plastocyanin domain-containing protein
MKKSLIAVFAVLIIAGIFIFENVNGNSIKNGDSFQKVTIDMQGRNYSPQVIEVKKDVPVRIYLSDNVRGCYRGLVIPKLGTSKYLPTSTDYLEVTFPEGEYTFACSMFMGTGKIVSK